MKTGDKILVLVCIGVLAFMVGYLLSNWLMPGYPQGVVVEKRYLPSLCEGSVCDAPGYLIRINQDGTNETFICEVGPEKYYRARAGAHVICD